MRKKETAGSSESSCGNVWAWMHRFVGVPVCFVLVLLAVMITNGQAMAGGGPIVIDGNYYEYGENRTYTSTDLEVTQGIEHKDTGSADLTVKSINTSSGVTVEASKAAAVYAHNGGKTYIRRSSDSDGAITITSSNGKAYGAYVDSADVALDVNTITAKSTSGNAYGVYGMTNGKLTVTNAEAISADSSNSGAYGADANSADVTLDVKTITAKGENATYGVRAQSSGKLTVNNVEVISADSRSGTADGAYANSADVTLDVKTISAKGTSATYGVAAELGGKLTVTSADKISAESNGSSAYGAYVSSNNTVASLDVKTITATGKTGSYGVFVGSGTMNLTNVDTVTASGGTENYSAYVSNSGATLNVSTDTTTTFTGEVSNTGTFNANSGNIDINGNVGNYDGTFNVNSGDVDINGNVANYSNFNVNGGTTTISGDLTGTGTTAISQDATLALKIGNSTPLSDQTIKNDGTLNFASGTPVLSTDVTGSGKTTVSENANLVVNGSTISQDLENAGTLSGSNMSVGGSLTNSGTATLNGATIGKSLTNSGTFNVLGTNTVTGNVANEGSLNVSAGGTTTISGDLTGTGSADIANGATLALKNSAVKQTVSNAGTLKFAEGTNTLKDSTVTGSGTTSVSSGTSLDVSNSTISQNLTNAGTLTGSNITLNGGIKNNGGNVDITVKSISTDSGVAAGDGKAAVFANNGGKTHIGRSNGSDGAITITNSSGGAYGVDVLGSGTEASLDVKEIAASGSAMTLGVVGVEGGKLTVTNVEKISAKSSSGYAYGAAGQYAGIVSITGSEGKQTSITATGKLVSAGVGSEGSTVNINNVNTIAASGDGQVYGVLARKSSEQPNSTINLTNVDTVTASGGTTNYSAYVTDSTSTLNVSTDATTTFNGNIYNAGTISGDNMIVNGTIENNGSASFDNLVVSKTEGDKLTAYGIKATGGTTSVVSGEVFASNTNNSVDITSKGEALAAVGVYASGNNTVVDMKDVKTISADAKTGTALALLAQSGGTIKGENIIVNGGIKNDGGSIDITVQSISTDKGALVDCTVNVIGTPTAINYAAVLANGGTTHIGRSEGSDGTITITNSNGMAYGASVSGDATELSLDVKTITANSTVNGAYGVSGFNSGKLTVTSADAISAESNTKKAYGAYAEKNSTVSINGSESKPTSITATGKTGSYGVYAKTGGTINLNNVGTVTANGDGTNYSAYVLENSTLNVSTDTTTTFNGDVSNTGTFNANSGDIDINGNVANNSNFNINAGTTTISGDLTGTGTTAISQDATLALKNSAVSEQTINNDGTLKFAEGDSTVDSSVSINGQGATEIVSGVAVEFAGANISQAKGVKNDGTASFTAGTTTISGDLTGTGSADIASGATLALKNSNVALSGDITNAGTLKFAEGANTVTGNVANAGSVNVSAGATTISGDLAGTGSADIANGATLALKNSNVALSGDITNAGTLNFAAGTNTLKDLTVTGSGTTSVSKDASLDVSNSTISQNLTNAGTLTGSNLTLNGGIENKGGNVNITVKSISTDSGVDAEDGKFAAAVYAHNGGTTYIGGKGDITISRDANNNTFGAYVSDNTEVSLDVKTIIAKGTGYANGCTAIEGSKLTVTNADAISAVSSGSAARGAYVTNSGTVVSLDVKTITTTGKSYSEGVFGNKYGKLTVTNAETISAVSSGSRALGAAAQYSADVMLDVKTITAKGEKDTYGVDGYDGGKLTVTNAEIISAVSSSDMAYGAWAYSAADVTLDVKTISAESNSGDAYGAYAEKNSTVSINGSESKLTSITATGKTGSYGVYANSGTINLTNVDTVTASSGDTNYSAYLKDSTSTLNVSTDTTTTFNGDVKNAGTLNINSGTAAVNGTLDLTGSTATVIKQNGKLVLAEKQKVNFGGANSFVINSGGSFTADAYNGNVLADGGFTVLETAKSAISADVDGAIELRLAADGTYKSYTTDDLKNVRKALYADEENGKLSFLNAIRKLTANETTVVKKADDSSKKVIITGGTKVVNKSSNADTDSADNSNLAQDADSDELTVTKVVSTKTGEVSELLQTVDEISLEGKEAIIETKQFQVKDSGGANAVTLSVNDGSTLKLSGGSTTDSSLVIDKDGNALKTDLEIADGTVEIGSYSEATEAQQGTINKITMTSGKLQLGVASGEASKPKTNYVFETLNIEDGSETAQINVLNSSLKVNNLNTGLNSNSAIYVDPAYMEIANVNNNTLGVNAYVSAGSVLNLGSTADLAAIATAAGMNPTQNETGFTVSKDEAVLALNDNYTLAKGTKLIVDAKVDENGNDDNNTNNADVYFGKKSLFVVNGSTASTGAALALNKQTVDVAAGSKLYINNAQALRTYTIFSGASDIYNWWNKTNIFMSKLIEDYDVNSTKNGLEIVVRGYNASNFADTVPYNSIKAMTEGSDPLLNTDSDYAGIRFLSRATDPMYLEASAMKPTLNEVSTISTTAAIQHAALRATDAMTDAVAEHMSTTLRANDSEIHDGDTTDVWATPFYRSMSWSGGGNDADGYMSGFSFGIDKHAGKNARYGLAMHYGTGSTDSDGAKTDTTNSSKAIGVSLYGSKQWGKLNVMGQIGYTDYDNTMSSYLPSTMNMPTITASPNASTFTADVRAERAYKSGTIDITPHAGVRYTRVMSDSFKTYLSETQSDSQNIVQFPVGVTFGVQRNAADGWKLKGLLDLAVVPVAGNKDAHTSVLFTGINNVWNDADTAILDSCSFRGSIGFTAERNYFSSNLGYALQTSSNETNHTFRLWLNWKLK